MSKIRAAGAVVIRNNDGVNEVLLVHRPSYKDWTLPKGKPDPYELRPCTAVREVREETGVLVRLGMPLSKLKYDVSKGKKVVDYWRATAVGNYHRAKDREVDEIRWVPVSKLQKMLTYDDELAIIHEALEQPETTPLLLVRHAKAMLRKHWTGNDQTRRLVARGREQAEKLIPLLESFGVAELWSSPSVRCVETLKPYGKYRGISTQTFPILTEEEGTKDLAEVEKFVRKLSKKLSQPTAICGHRPVLPAMQAGFNIERRPNAVSEVTVMHRDSKGNNVHVEIYKPKV